MSAPEGVFVHPQGICESPNVGFGSRVWAFAHVLPGARIGRNCNVCDHVFVEDDVVVGDDVTLKSGVQLWNGVRLGHRVFVGPNATFTNDPFPRSKQYPERFPETSIGDGASIGGNATILPGVKVGREAMIGAGAVVTRNVPAHAVVAGNPARVQAMIAPGPAVAIGTLAADTPLGVGGCTLVPLVPRGDARGTLLAIEHAALPFVPRRTFLVYGVQPGHVRGDHAHRACSQFLFVVAGRANVFLDDGVNRREIVLDASTAGIVLPPMTWATLYRFDPGTVLNVIASHPFDEADYIRDYETFFALAGGA